MNHVYVILIYLNKMSSLKRLKIYQQPKIAKLNHENSMDYIWFFIELIHKKRQKISRLSSSDENLIDF